MTNKTFSEIETEVNKFAIHSESIVITESTPDSDIIKTICNIYKSLKPILAGVLLIPLIPDPIKQPIKVFMDIMNQICK